ncbi:DNA transformation protein [Luteimonas cucumeris]|uniref:DNA transformation protein n=1 Tax=Luteimonas cucumeris TaxID=985012 RepID=A0A562L099_9GAMM|nr:TfoX/Sxy family protein [Luteimonas cucumeris]TWI01038.1 DNA transformation protein [Luteimonas cucumeris]
MRRVDPFIAHLLELLSPIGEPTARRLFGGWGIYLDETMIGLVSEETFYLKTDESTRGAFEAAGSSPFVFEARKRARTIVTGYWSVPEQALDAAEAMLPWAQLALEAARRKAAATPKRRRLS